MKNIGSKGEHILQRELGTSRRASVFYNMQMLDYLNPGMRKFVSRQEMVFIATSDSNGECDCSFRAGDPGFVRIINSKNLICPEYRGNGVMASLGNILENQHIGMVFIDFYESTVGLHVNGKARVISNKELLEIENIDEGLKNDIQVIGGRKPEQWILIKVEEAYIHCSKHIPLLKKLDKRISSGTDNDIHKGRNFFNTK